ncbi:MAG: hypothetical protein A2Z97_06985 [Bdellovibrionales bacterium GWB1_52_6]|nr:MAG: hypothetical protein A2Z97_06985 [Bdellovibrionales bacterium GWB1_52_6]OFZ05449.1 MAG: hypothetical protein A2X97_11265 [Bdellovibrionales bacterium GWA1_52_35]HCM39187.1 hypothetical protein [Bdellovibrionales bacterium]
MSTRFALLIFLVAALVTGCASYPPLSGSSDSGRDPQQQGPQVISADLQTNPAAPVKVTAEVRPTGARVKEVRLVFQEAPIELRMVQVSDTQWEVIVPSSRLQQLSIPGQTTLYHARVIALDEGGLLSMANPVLQLSVQATG